jgi:hypothetical protein
MAVGVAIMGKMDSVRTNPSPELPVEETAIDAKRRLQRHGDEREQTSGRTLLNGIGVRIF